MSRVFIDGVIYAVVIVSFVYSSFRFVEMTKRAGLEHGTTLTRPAVFKVWFGLGVVAISIIAMIVMCFVDPDGISVALILLLIGVSVVGGCLAIYGIYQIYRIASGPSPFEKGRFPD